MAGFFIFCFVVFFVASSTVSADTNQTGQTFLQKHASFFDRNKDGVIYPWETFQGFRAIGAGVPLSTVGSIFINMALSNKTRPGKPLSLLYPIEIENIKLGIHGSHSGSYDPEGRFVPEKFEEIFKKHAHKNPESLTYDELSEMLKANREPNDRAGWIGALSEWNILFLLFKDKNGVLQKETLKAVYDGSLFFQKEKELQSAKTKA